VDSLGNDFDALLTLGASVALAVAGLWALTVLAAVALEARTGGRVRLAERTGCPRDLRLWLLAAFVTLFAAAPADASDTGSGPAAVVDGLPLPDRTTGARQHVVLVAPGDSLWSITRAALPGTSSDATVAAAVARVHAANRRVIGPDPDVLVPGQRLLVDPSHIPTEAP
jgi:hypothetical protein